MDGEHAFEAEPIQEIGSLFRVQLGCSNGERDMNRLQTSFRVKCGPSQKWRPLNRNGHECPSVTSSDYVSKIIPGTCRPSLKTFGRYREVLGAARPEYQFVLEVVS